MIAIVDYGMGNLRSVEKGFEKAGAAVKIVTEPGELEAARGIVLPGVGAFADAMNNLSRNGMDRAIVRAIEAGRPFLGICLGLQVLFESSEEWGYSRGLGIIKGTVRRLPPGLKVPHMGWNQVEFAGGCPIFEGLPDRSSFYFVHSYYVDPEEKEVSCGVTDYGIIFTSAVRYRNVLAIQFHPEKSSSLGLDILRNFRRYALDGGVPGN